MLASKEVESVCRAPHYVLAFNILPHEVRIIHYYHVVRLRGLIPGNIEWIIVGEPDSGINSKRFAKRVDLEIEEIIVRMEPGELAVVDVHVKCVPRPIAPHHSEARGWHMTRSK